MLEIDRANAVLSRCLHASIDFWELGGWEVSIGTSEFGDDEQGAAVCEIQEKYRRALILADISRVESLEELWQVIAHEACHIVTAEYRLFHLVVPTDEATDVIWGIACERTTSQLESVFLRERPYPGDKEFTL